MIIRKAIIPVAGLGSRLLPLTKSLPKEMLPIGRKPIIHHVVEEILDAGITNILLITSKRNRSIEDYFNNDPWLVENLSKNNKAELLQAIDFSKLKCSFSYIHQDIPAGIADAILLAEDFIGNEPFILHMGDSIVKNDQGIIRRMLNLHARNNISGFTVAVTKMSEEEIKSHGRVVPKVDVDIEHPYFEITNIINYKNIEIRTSNYGDIGRYIFNSNIFKAIKQTSYKEDLSKAKQLLILQGLSGLAVKLKPEEKFCNAGDFESYFKTFIEFLIKDEKYGNMARNYLKQHLP